MGILFAFGLLAAGLTALRWADAKEKATRRLYEQDGK